MLEYETITQEKESKIVSLTKIGLENYDLDADHFIKIWDKSAPDLKYAASRNLRAMAELGSDAVSFLTEEFGVYNFARYPKGVLLSQIGQHEDLTRPYVAWMNTHYDHSGLFYTFNQQIQKFLNALNGEVNLRIVEFGADIDQDPLIRLKAKYGSPCATVVGAHGWKSGIQIDKDLFLTIDDILCLEEDQSLRDMLAERTSVVLASCYTGADSGFAQAFSQVTKTRVTGPLYRTSLDDVVPTMIEGRFGLDVAFVHNPSIRDRDCPLRGDNATYENGELVALRKISVFL